MTQITQTFLNSKFEIAYFKAGGWMGVEEEKARQQEEGWVSSWKPAHRALRDFKVEE